MDTHVVTAGSNYTGVDDLGGDFVYIAFIDVSTDASGYTSTLIWRNKPY